MLDLNEKVQVIAVSDINIEKTLNSLIKTQKSLNISESYFFTSKLKKVERLVIHKNIVHIIRINPINSLKDYSDFIIYKLHNYITKKHCLITQWDGFSMCNWMWEDFFLEFDYIGAPFIQRKKDPYYCLDKKGIFRSVGNGGFSLRSKALLAAPTKLFLEDEYKYTNNHEDGFFSVLHRFTLESKGFKWAPESIARKFSQEQPRNVTDLINPSFGCHGKIYNLISKFWALVNFFIFVKKMCFLRVNYLKNIIKN